MQKYKLKNEISDDLKKHHKKLAQIEFCGYLLVSGTVMILASIILSF